MGKEDKEGNNGRWTHWHPCSSQSFPSSRGSPTPLYTHTHAPTTITPDICQGKERLPSRTFPVTSCPAVVSAMPLAVTGMAWGDFLSVCI